MEILARAVGRRKEAVAQVQIVRGTGQFMINNKAAQEYLHNNQNSLLSVKSPFDVLLKLQSNVISEQVTPQKTVDGIDTIVKVKGGGLIGQAEAIKLGVARALCLLNALENHTFSLSQKHNSDQMHVHEADVSKITLNEVDGSGESSTVQSLPVSQNEIAQTSTLRKQLKDKGYLTQDSRVKERRKYGLKKARKASQYHKR